MTGSTQNFHLERPPTSSVRSGALRSGAAAAVCGLYWAARTLRRTDHLPLLSLGPEKKDYAICEDSDYSRNITQLNVRILECVQLCPP